MARKRIPLLTRDDPNYSASLPQREAAGIEGTYRAPAEDLDTSAQFAPQTDVQPRAPDPIDLAAVSAKIDVRVTALARHQLSLFACGIAPEQVIRAALRRAVKSWEMTATYVHPPDVRRAKDPTWTVRTSVAVSAATFDRLQADRDPLGVCSRWSLVRGQLEPLVWGEIDTLLASLTGDENDT